MNYDGGMWVTDAVRNRLVGFGDWVYTLLAQADDVGCPMSVEWIICSPAGISKSPSRLLGAITLGLRHAKSISGVVFDFCADHCACLIPLAIRPLSPSLSHCCCCCECVEACDTWMIDRMIERWEKEWRAWNAKKRTSRLSYCDSWCGKVNELQDID